MYRLLEFIRSTYVVILFILLETIAISHYAWSSSYSRAKIFVLTNSIVGGANGLFHNTTHLFSLPEENKLLVEQIAELKEQLDTYEAVQSALPPEEILYHDPAYSYVVGRVVSNSINKSNNYIVIDKGIENGVHERMAVITPAGEMIGYVKACTDRYCAALSILSSDFTTSGKLKDGKNYGSISWNNQDRYHVSMNELSKYEDINRGDTVVTTGFSQIFPRGVTIGRVESFEFNEMQTAYNVTVELAVDVTSIDYVLLVSSREQGEVDSLLDMINTNY